MLKENRKCVETFVCFDDRDEFFIEHGPTHGPHCFQKDLPLTFKQTISVSELAWVVGVLIFGVVALAISMIDCAFWAKLVYFTNWGLIASDLYFFIRLLGVLENRYQQKYVCCLYSKDAKETPYKMNSCAVFLWGLTMQLQLVVWVWETFIFVLYWGFGGDERTLDFISVSAHLVIPIIIWVDIWASAIPFPVEHLYKIPFYASLYPLFGVIHYVNDMGHLGSTPEPCAPSYYYSLTVGQNWVYENFNFANPSTYGYVDGMVCVLCPALGFITYILKKCWEDDENY